MNATLLLYACKYRYRHAPVTKHKQIQASGESREHLQGQAGELNKNKWLIETKNTYAFFLPFCPPPSPLPLLPPSIAISSSPTLCRSDEYHPSKSEMQRNLSHFSPLFPLSYLSLFSLFPPSVSLAPLSFSRSLYPVSLSTFPSSPLHMWISFSLIMMI